MKSELTPVPRILLIEDDTFLVGMYVTKLEHEHFETLVAPDGAEGLVVARTMVPDLVLLDIRLPTMNGWEVLEELKRDPTTRAIPVILLTNLGDKKDVEKGMALGAADYLIKAHFMPSEVIQKIMKTIRDTRTLRSIG